MDSEEKKSELRLKSKVIEVGFDSDDDEPIGSLFKLKRPRNAKKVKVGLKSGKGQKVEAEAEKLVDRDVDIAGMDDTLAIFRKKLKGPKKDIGSGTPKGRTLALSRPENGDGVSNVQLGPKKQEKSWDVTDNGTDATGRREARRKRKAKRPKIDSNMEDTGGQAVYDGLSSQDGTLEDQKQARLQEGSDHYSDQKQEDSLSAIFQRVQSSVIRKSRMNSSLGQNSKDLNLDEISNPSSEGDAGAAKSVRGYRSPSPTEAAWKKPKFDNDVNSDSELNNLNVALERCSKTVESVTQTSGSHGQELAFDLTSSNEVCDGDGSAHSQEAKSEIQALKDGLKFCSMAKGCILVSKEVLHPASSPRQIGEFHEFGDKVNRGSIVAPGQQSDSVSGVNTRSTDLEISSSLIEKEASAGCANEGLTDNPCKGTSKGICKLASEGVQLVSAKSTSQNSFEAVKSDEFDFDQCIDGSQKINSDCVDREPKFAAFSDKPERAIASDRNLSPKPEISSGLWESGTTLDKRSLDLNQNQPSDAFQETSNDEEANKLSTSMSPENAVSGPDSGDRDNKLSAVQRALRNAKKRRHGDMAYEGDADWEVLMSEQVFLDDDQVVDCDRSLRMPDRFDLPSSLLMECENGVVAAVSAGLKARAAGPIEKIKFKEVLKRKGGLQEYLRCRNKILSLWSKDVTRILPLAECGVTDTPSANEPLRASLIREIYTFLDQSGYINIGIASKKGKGDDGARNGYKLFKEEKLDRSSGVSIADSEDGVAFILGQVKSSETNMDTKNGVLDYENRVSGAHKGKGGLMTSEISDVKEHVLQTDNWQKNGRIDVNLPISLDVVAADSSCQADDIGSVPVIEGVDNSCGFQYASYDDAQEEAHLQCNSEIRKKIIVIGAGPAGLTAARHLQRQGFAVTILEARNRIGGRVYTDRSSLSVPVDLGASIITGVEADVDTERRPDPSSLVCAQLGLELTVLNSDCPLYDVVSGDKVPADLDEALEAEFNSLLDDMLLLVAQKGDHAMQMSLEAGLEYALKRRRMARLGRDFDDKELHSLDAYSKTSSNDSRVSDTNCRKDEVLSPLERRVMDWHFANLEYGCAALLKEVSLPFWNQDDVYGGFGGAHCMIKDGYSTVVETIGKELPIHLNHVVTDISYSSKDTGMCDSQCNKVKVGTSNGKEFNGDAVLITVPLGCLKAESIRFSPPLPQWKHSAIQRLGFGVLNKVVLEFPEVFWDDSVDYFGATAEETDWRGRCFMFWNVRKTVGAPVLIALVVGKAAIDGQNMSSSDQVKHAVNVLRKIFGEASVPDPVASVVTDWGQDPFSYGAYSYVAIGASGEDYDILGKPVENCLFFAGEATCKEHPDTVGGAMMSGLREAVRVIDILTTGNDYTAEVEAMEAAQRQLESEGDEVRDITRRLEAVQLSNTLYKNSLDRALILTRESLLQDMFFNAKTTAGRLHLAKELLNLPVSTLKSFAGTKEGLTVLNSWILDSMGKDGTQLLRHCLRLLVRVSTDLHAVRVSGIGKTVKEKVCVHTSRDIRAIASQLVNVWLEVFRKEKASGGVKLARQLNADSLKRKSLKDPAPGKPPLRSNSGVLENKGSTGSHMLSNSNIKKGSGKSVKLDTVSHSLMDRLDDEVEQKSSAMSEEERAAFAAAEAARVAAEAAARAAAEATAKAFASSGMQLPKIPSFHKFARREQYGHIDESDLRRKWSGAASGRQDCISEIDSRNCRVRDWPVDFSAACVNLDSSRMSADNLSQRSHSNEIASHMNFREHSGESAAGDSSLFTKAWVDTAGGVGVKDYHAIERWQSQAAAADSDFYQTAIHVGDEEDSNRSFRPHIWKNDGRANESSISQVTVNKEPPENRPRGADRIKQAVVDYVASLLMPLYKARKLDRDSYKSIMKKSATKVMEQATDAEKAMAVSEFLDFKRRNKIRAFVDRLIEKHMPVKPTAKS